jgi:IS5 family transposase
LRVHFLQQRFALCDETTEEDLREIPFCRAFAGIDPGATGTPDATTILRFRHLFERHDLATALVQEVNALLGGRGQMVRRGTPIDATPARARGSTRNRIGTGGPEMHRTRKGNQWFFAMKAHIGVDADSRLVHTVVAMQANVHDLMVTGSLLHADEVVVHGMSGHRPLV